MESVDLHFSIYGNCMTSIFGHPGLTKNVQFYIPDVSRRTYVVNLLKTSLEVIKLVLLGAQFKVILKNCYSVQNLRVAINFFTLGLNYLLLLLCLSNSWQRLYAL